jgi:hypothetical protein
MDERMHTCSVVFNATNIPELPHRKNLRFNWAIGGWQAAEAPASKGRHLPWEAPS